MTVATKTQLNSKDAKMISKSEMELHKGAIDKTQAKAASTEAGSGSNMISKSEIASGEGDYAGEKKHKCERVKNLSAKINSKSLECNLNIEKSKGIKQMKNEFKICDGTNIGDCNVRKKRKYIEKAIKSNFASHSSEESLGDECVAKTNVSTQDSCEKNLKSKNKTAEKTIDKTAKKAIVKNPNNQSLSKNIVSQETENQKSLKKIKVKDAEIALNVAKKSNDENVDKELKGEVANVAEKKADSKEVAVSELEKGVLIAVRVLVEMMSDETATNALKVDCAKEILTRLYGKTFEKTNETCEIEISQELKEYCE